MAHFANVFKTKKTTEITMREGGKKRMHLIGAGAEKKDLQLKSSRESIASVKLTALYDGKKGIWTVDIKALTKGKVTIEALSKKTAIAKLSINVVERLSLPAKNTDEGLLTRLFLAESVNPGSGDYDADDSKTGMQWMKLVIYNRLKNKPKRFYAADAKTIKDIVRAKRQFEGFEKYPAINSKQQGNIDEILKIANNDSDGRQHKYQVFVKNALTVANSKTLVSDPSKNGLYGWRTAGSRPPGGDLVAYGKPLSGQQFYTLKTKPDKKK